MKIIQITETDGDYIHWCQGCQQEHLINTKRENINNARWKFNGNFEKPTFTPSVNIENGQCHYNITDGMIVYHDAKRHSLGGKTLPLLETP